VPQLIAAALIAKDPTRYGMELHPQPAFTYDSVQVPGSTPLAAIAAATGTSVAAIAELNPQLLRGMTPPKTPYLIRVPVGAAVTFDSSLAALPENARTATRTVETKKGDSIERLASAHGIGASALVSFNPKLRRLKSGRLAPGQPVLIPSAAVAAAALKVPDPGIEKYPGSTKRVKLYTVKKGETLGAIARRNGTTTERIMRLNGLKKPMIFPGQSLIVAGTAGKAKSAKTVSTSKSKSSSKSKKSATKKRSSANSKAGAKKKSA